MTSYSCDADGNLTSKTEAQVIITCFGTLSGATCDGLGYDVLNRLKKKMYSDGTPAVLYVATNGKGREPESSVGKRCRRHPADAYSSGKPLSIL